jgi:hypothetical protein
MSLRGDLSGTADALLARDGAQRFVFMVQGPYLRGCPITSANPHLSTKAPHI